MFLETFLQLDALLRFSQTITKILDTVLANFFQVLLYRLGDPSRYWKIVIQ